LLAVSAILVAAQFGLIPAVVRISWPVALALLLLVALTTPLHWGLAHESFHGLLSRDARINRLLGRSLTIPLGMSWDLVRFGHLNHHDANRHLLDRPEVLPEGLSWHRGALTYYAKLFGGHALLSAMSSLLAWLPDRAMNRAVDRISGDVELKKFHVGAMKNLTSPERRARIRIDSFASLMLHAAALFLWGHAWPVFAASCMVRYAVLSLMDNAPHYGTALDSGTDARNTGLPGWSKYLVLNQNFHGIHHEQPALRWRALELAFAQSGRGFNGSWLGSISRQLNGPVRATDLTPVFAAGGR
jgi:fatty acid desaturase